MKFLRINKRVLAFVAALTATVICMVFVFGLIEHFADETEADASFLSEKNSDTVFFKGENYRPKRYMETVLVLGIDESEDPGREEHHQSDFVALLIFDNHEKTYQILHINRDTMTEYSVTDIYGQFKNKQRGQLALAHAYGSNDTARCLNTKRAVENLLYGIYIDHYISLTMDGVAVLNDSVGGVTLTLMDDFTMYHPNYTEGSTVTLKGDDALAYVRARGSLENSTNLHRMERQQQYLEELFIQCKKKLSTSEGFMTDTLLSLNSYTVSDCSVQRISDFAEKVKEYRQVGTIMTLEGTSVKGDKYMEYHIDEEKAQEMIISLFYNKAK